MQVITTDLYIEITADEGKTLHKTDAEGVYCKQVCAPLGTDTTVWEEIPDSDVPAEDEDEYTDDYYAEAGKILLGKETD